MRRPTAVRTAASLLLLLAACDEPKLDTAWLQDKAWEDGKAVVSVFKGRYNRYGKWRDCEVRDYIIREYLHPEELTKRDRPDDSLIPVLKINRHITFRTGTYDYRLMHTLFLERETGHLVKAAGTSQEGCGIAFQRWDRNSRAHSYDTYWEGEGSGSRPLAKKGAVYFADEIPFVLPFLPDSVDITIVPSLASSSLRGKTVRATTGQLARGKRRIDGYGTFEYDDDGFLLAWKIDGKQEFRRVSKRRLYYWQHTDPGDERLLEAE